MLIKPVNIISFGSKIPASSNEESLLDGDFQKLDGLRKRLERAYHMLGCGKGNGDKEKHIEALKYDIDDVLAHIIYLQKSIRNKNKEDSSFQNQRGDKQKSAMMSMLMSAQNIQEGEIPQLEKDAQRLIAETYKTLGFELLGKDLVVNIKKKSELSKVKSFEDSDKKLELDEYQQNAVDAFRAGNSVLVTAPTGTGKTLIAEHIIDDIIKSGRRVIYTTPLKALCNDKYKQFSKLWGDYNENGELVGTSKVGLATGDVKINPNASLVVMTTEIYRNMLLQKGSSDVEKELKNVDAVIFDEFHYMGDNDRGSVWEEAVMFSPPRIKHLMLSATVANSNQLNDWMNRINDEHKASSVNVPEEERHVPLKHFAYSSVRNSLQLYDLTEDTIDLQKLTSKKLTKREKEVLAEIAKLFNSDDGLQVLKSNFSRLFGWSKKASAKSFIDELVRNNVPYQKAEQYALRLSDKKSQKMNDDLLDIQSMEQVPLISLVRELNRKKMTPALYFSYSKRNCKKLMMEASKNVGSLLTREERNEILNRIDRINQKGIFLGTDFETDIKPCLLNGFAMHHAGMMPQCKSFIESLGRSKLVKVCFATDTLGAGINFPFKTVIFSDFEKYGDGGFEEISVNSFKQGAGRAGRRGIDDIGYVISIPKDRNEVMIPYKKIVLDSDEIRSAFKMSYGLVLSPRFLNCSEKALKNTFAYYQTNAYGENLKKSEAMKDILKDRKFIEEKNHIFRLTDKGRIAANVRGINEILLTEILTDNKITENITPTELACLISVFAPENTEEEQETQNSWSLHEGMTQKVMDAISLASEIKICELQRGIDSGINVNQKILPYIKMWAEIGNSKDNSVLWSSIINDVVGTGVVKTEGDFLKKINYTTNILKQITQIAPTPYLRKVASDSIKLLQKSPVNDILLYELDYKKDE